MDSAMKRKRIGFDADICKKITKTSSGESHRVLNWEDEINQTFPQMNKKRKHYEETGQDYDEKNLSNTKVSEEKVSR